MIFEFSIFSRITGKTKNKTITKEIGESLWEHNGSLPCGATIIVYYFVCVFSVLLCVEMKWTRFKTGKRLFHSILSVSWNFRPKKNGRKCTSKPAWMKRCCLFSWYPMCLTCEFKNADRQTLTDCECKAIHPKK